MRATYYAAPAGRSFAPAKWIADERKALEFARNATDAFRVGYTVCADPGGPPEACGGLLSEPGGCVRGTITAAAFTQSGRWRASAVAGLPNPAGRRTRSS